MTTISNNITLEVFLLHRNSVHMQCSSTVLSLAYLRQSPCPGISTHFSDRRESDRGLYCNALFSSPCEVFYSLRDFLFFFALRPLLKVVDYWKIIIYNFTIIGFHNFLPPTSSSFLLAFHSSPQTNRLVSGPLLYSKRYFFQKALFLNFLEVFYLCWLFLAHCDWSFEFGLC